jgi:hypothetical protein
MGWARLRSCARWAAKERNEGEAHPYTDAELDDAWLMVHVVGGPIVRLAGSPRGTATEESWPPLANVNSIASDSDSSVLRSLLGRIRALTFSTKCGVEFAVI